MEILTKDINEITFEDVVEFCKLKIIEGVNLEYKKKFPKGELTKQFVTFSNTKGGMIIIGVEEDSKTGLPLAWEGVDNEGKLEDMVHQHAGNVIPLPSYQTSVVDNGNGKAFVLIKIDEGANPPYSSKSDPTPWIRTGNISKPIDHANRDDLLMLHAKRSEATNARETARSFSVENFTLDLIRAEKERLAIEKEQEKDPEATFKVYAHSLTSPKFTSVFSASIMPYYPGPDLFTYSMLNKPHELLGHDWQKSLFTGGHSTIPGGISRFLWNQTYGEFAGEQVFMNGHVFKAADVVKGRNDKVELSAYSLGFELYPIMQAATNLYRKADYHGQVSIVLSLTGGVGIKTSTISQNQWFRDNGFVKFDEYRWEETTDTATLNSNESAADLFAKLLINLCWDLGLGEVHKSQIEYFMGQNGWFGKRNT